MVCKLTFPGQISSQLGIHTHIIQRERERESCVPCVRGVTCVMAGLGISEDHLRCQPSPSTLLETEWLVVRLIRPKNF